MSPKHIPILLSLLLVATLLLPAGTLSSGDALAGTSAISPQAPAVFGGPLFIENTGQWPAAARFQVWGGGQTLWLAEDAVWLSQVEGSRSKGQGRRADEPDLQPATFQPATSQAVNIRLSFPGANPHPVLEPFERLDTHVSYFIGADPAQWRTDVPVWAGVRYRDLYPGVDLVVGASPAPAAPAPAGGQPQGSPLPWRLEQRDGADPAAVCLYVEGADAVAVDGDALRLTTTAGDLTLPLITVEGANSQQPAVRRLTASAFAVSAPFAAPDITPAPLDASGLLSAIRNPQSAGPLYATFLGGSREDDGDGIAVDAAGSAYVISSTNSSDFPTTPGAFDTSYNGGPYHRDYDAFVVKLNPTGSALAYATFLGGSDYDVGFDIAVDAAGSAYVTGCTSSSDFPTTPGAFGINWGYYDVFVVKLNPTGSALTYATFLGGWSDDWGYRIAVDVVGSAYVAGYTHSNNFPTTPGAFDTSYNGGYDAFVVKLSSTGSALAYATYLGDSRGDYGYGIAVDAAGSAYVTGETYSSGFPTTPDAFDTSYNGGYDDAFVVKLNPTGSALAYATFLGGSDYDEGNGIAVDAAGSAYVAGDTRSSDFPTTPGAFDASHNGHDGDAFVVKLNPTGSALAYATFLGGSDYDFSYGIAVDAAGSAYVTGSTYSSDFPTMLGAFDTSRNDNYYRDAFVVKLNSTNSAPAYATFLGGSGYDDGNGIAVDAAGSAYVTGGTWSPNFPTTPGAFDISRNGFYEDAFVVKLDLALNSSSIFGVVWHDANGDGVRAPAETGIPGVQVCAEPLRHLSPRCATSGEDGAFQIEVAAAGTYMVAPSAAPAGMQLTTQGFRLPVIVRAGQQAWNINFGYR